MPSSYDLGAVSSYEIAVQNGFEGTVQEWVEAIINASATYDDLRRQITALELLIPPVDSTLSQNNAAANAYAVGQEIARLDGADAGFAEDIAEGENRLASAEINIGSLTERADSTDEWLERLQSLISTPLTASTVTEMADTTKVYIYTGSETGYTFGNWYYWNGLAWTSGGVYNAEAIVTDTTLSIAGQAADAKVVGDKMTPTAIYIGTDGKCYAKLEDV